MGCMRLQTGLDMCCLHHKKRVVAPAVIDEDAAAEARRLRATGTWLAGAL